ncbi:MAG TPA: hypothetical protein VFS08_19850 [Gemmatimonadaceae bacterium]|nr:hypothetical protein [Gemmatimonadaceae bacterium]
MRLHYLMACAVLAGCASGGASVPGAGPREVTTRVETAEGPVDFRMVPSDPSAAFTIEAPPDSTWRVLALVYDQLKLHVTTLDTENRRLGVENARILRRLGGTRLSKYLSCGERLGQPVAETDEIRLTLLTQVVPDGPNRSTLHTLVNATAKQTGSGGAPIQCATTGILEQEIVKLVRSRTAQ